MLSGWTIVLISLLYMGLLFGLAYYGDRSDAGKKWASNPVIYSLSLAVYCSSWTFYGAVGRAATTGWEFLATYLGPVLVFTLGWRIVEKMILISKQQNITTISDFISSRYGKSQLLAILVTGIAILGILPYIALQLKAIAASYTAMSVEAGAATTQGSDTALVVALAMAVFGILFGTRHIDATEHHEGLVLAIAFESMVKLTAFFSVGLFVTFGVFGSPVEMTHQVMNQLRTSGHFDSIFNGSFITEIVLATGAVICLPRQFHVTIVENTRVDNLRTARWMFPLYLLLLALFVLPIATAGINVFGIGIVDPDSFVLRLPLAHGADLLSTLAFIGGLSAGTSMVIVSSITLATMVCNDIVTPLLLHIPRLRISQNSDLGTLLLRVRRITIISLMLMGYFYYRIFSEQGSLASFGLVAFVAAIQFLPAIIGGLYWQRGNRYGALAGISVGFGVWLYTLVLPLTFKVMNVDPSNLLTQYDMPNWINPLSPFDIHMDPLSNSVLWSLVFNILCYVVGSTVTRQRLVDRIQASAFINTHNTDFSEPGRLTSQVTVGDLQVLTERFLGISRTQRAFASFASERDESIPVSGARATPELIQYIERLLAGVIGASSARIVMDSTLRGKDMQIGDVVEIVSEASQALRFNRSLLQSTIENISLGISVVDQHLRLIAWNQRYIEMFNYPEGLVCVGRPIAEILRYNAIRGEYGLVQDRADDQVEERLQKMTSAQPHAIERYRPDGTVLEIRGNPMPDGGYVNTYMDITQHKRTEEALRESEQNIRIYTDNVPALIAYLDPHRNYLFINKAYAEAYGVDRHTIAGTPSSRVLPPDIYKARQPYVARVLNGERQRFETRMPTRDGSLRYAEITYIPHIGDYGDLLGYFVLYQDITERREAEKALKETNENLELRVNERTHALSVANKELRKENTIRALMEDELRQAKSDAESANISKTRFLAAASHDLLQPLNAARLFTSALAQQSHEPQTSQLVENLDNSLRSAEELITAILDISKLDAGALEPNLSHFALSNIFQQLATEFTVVAKEKNLTFHCVNSKVVVHSDQALLRRVLQNFVSNAMRYTTEGKVLLGARRSGNFMRLEVWDTGVGIPKDKIKEVFEEFRRIDNPRHSQVKGLGLGLAITDRIARMLGHEIHVRSEVGKGTVFSIDVPLGDITKAQHNSEKKRGWIRSKAFDGVKILVIDNEPKILEGMEALLAGWACDVKTALSTQSAVEIAEAGQWKADVILADYHLGETETGLMSLHALEQHWGNVPSIVITADRTDEVKAEIEEAGAQLLTKPIKPAALRAMINKIVAQ